MMSVPRLSVYRQVLEGVRENTIVTDTSVSPRTEEPLGLALAGVLSFEGHATNGRYTDFSLGF